MIDKRAKGLIFDIDGTLVDSMPVHYKASQLVCNKLGFDFPLDYFYAKAGIPTIQVFEMLMADLDLPHDGRKLAIEKDELYMQMGSELTEIKMVADIARKHYGTLPMALGTGAHKEMALMNIKATGLETLFDIVIAANDVTKHKPDPETFLRCAELMQVDPKHCQVFEDGEMGLQAAREAGMIATDVRPFLK